MLAPNMWAEAEGRENANKTPHLSVTTHQQHHSDNVVKALHKEGGQLWSRTNDE